MSKNSVDAYGAEGKSNVLFFDPDALKLVDDPAHPLYDERVNLPLDEAMVLNIMTFGVKQAIGVWKDPETGEVLVVAGRQRVKHTREANRRLAAQGSPLLQVPGIVSKGNVEHQAAFMVLENEIRQDDTPLGRARKMQQFAARNQSPESIAVIFGCTAPNVRQLLGVLEQPAAVQKAVEAGQITITAAHKLAKLTPDEQRIKVAEMVKAGAGLTGHAKARAVRAASGEAVTRMRSRSDVVKALETATGDVKVALQWVLDTNLVWTL